MNYIITSKGPP